MASPLSLMALTRCLEEEMVEERVKEVASKVEMRYYQRCEYLTP